MNVKRWSNALFFIAASALSTWATAENIYKCGTSYSQSPCPGGKVVNVDDSRDPQQKKSKDEITQRDAELAREMEKDRLANEKAWRAADAKPPVVTKKSSKRIVVKEEPKLIKPKRLKHPSTKNKDFIAQVPGSEQQPAKKKRTKKTEVQAEP